MAKVVTIEKSDSLEEIRKKLQTASEPYAFGLKAFDATRFTGKVISYGDGLLFQKNLRDEWR